MRYTFRVWIKWNIHQTRELMCNKTKCLLWCRNRSSVLPGQRGHRIPRGWKTLLLLGPGSMAGEGSSWFFGILWLSPFSIPVIFLSGIIAIYVDNLLYILLDNLIGCISQDWWVEFAPTCNYVRIERMHSLCPIFCPLQCIFSLFKSLTTPNYWDYFLVLS